MIKRMPAYEACNYMQVIKILEMKDGAVYRTQSTDFYIRDEDAANLPSGYTTAPVSMILLRQETVELNIVSAKELS